MYTVDKRHGEVLGELRMFGPWAREGGPTNLAMQRTRYSQSLGRLHAMPDKRFQHELKRLV
jgi:hypothetical protein